MNLDLFLTTIPYALKGWLAIFIVTLIIVCCISLLNKAGVHLAQTFAGTGYNAGTEVYQDYDAAVYYIEEIRG